MGKPLSWKPVRRGATYCAPACGGGCTRDSFEMATSSAKLLANGLGSAWVPHVWENLGWHFIAKSKNGSASVSVSGAQYYASIRVGVNNFMAYASTPRRAFTLALGKASTMLARARVDLAELEAAQ